MRSEFRPPVFLAGSLLLLIIALVFADRRTFTADFIVYSLAFVMVLWAVWNIRLSGRARYLPENLAIFSHVIGIVSILYLVFWYSSSITLDWVAMPGEPIRISHLSRSEDWASKPLMTACSAEELAGRFQYSLQNPDEADPDLRRYLFGNALVTDLLLRSDEALKGSRAELAALWCYRLSQKQAALDSRYLWPFRLFRINLEYPVRPDGFLDFEKVKLEAGLRPLSGTDLVIEKGRVVNAGGGVRVMLRDYKALALVKDAQSGDLVPLFKGDDFNGSVFRGVVQGQVDAWPGAAAALGGFSEEPGYRYIHSYWEDDLGMSRPAPTQLLAEKGGQMQLLNTDTEAVLNIAVLRFYYRYSSFILYYLYFAFLLSILLYVYETRFKEHHSPHLLG